MKKDPDKLCMYCKFFSSRVGIGYGMRCRQPENKEEIKPGKFWHMRVPSRWHSCEHFEKLEEKDS